MFKRKTTRSRVRRWSAKIERLESRQLLAALIGVDFDVIAGGQPPRPDSWNVADFGTRNFGFDTLLQNNLIDELGESTPIELTITSPIPDSVPGTLDFANNASIAAATLPSRSVGLPTLANLGGWQFVDGAGQTILVNWRKLSPFTRYDVFVFGLEGDGQNSSQSVSINGGEVSFTQSPTTSGSVSRLWINGQEGTNAPLDDFAVRVMPNSDGQIEILVTATSPRNSAALGGVAIREAERLPILVNMSGDVDDNNPFNGQTTLREAIAIANSRAGADEIIFDNTVFGSPSTLTLASGELGITDSVSIIGPGANQLTIDAGGASRHFRINDNSSALIDVTLANLTLFGGNNRGSGSGGAIQSSENVTILNSVISGNTTTGANFGGGIFHSAGLMTIRNSTLSGNTSYSGGAIINYPGTGMVIENTTISGNRTNVYAGGAIFNQAPLTIRNSTITNNISDHSAGIFSRYINSPQLVIQNSIIAGNRMPNDTPSDLRGTVPTITHSLVGSNNLSGLTAAAAADANGNLIGTNGAVIDPKLGPLAFNGGTTQTHALLANSPAINAGNNTLISGQTADQRGAPFVRIADNIVDMGAFERQTLARDLAVIEGIAFIDANNNGEIDLGEGRLQNVLVSLYLDDVNPNGQLDPGETLVGTFTTGPDGTYRFENLDGADDDVPSTAFATDDGLYVLSFTAGVGGVQDTTGVPLAGVRLSSDTGVLISDDTGLQVALIDDFSVGQSDLPATLTAPFIGIGRNSPALNSGGTIIGDSRDLDLNRFTTPGTAFFNVAGGVATLTGTGGSEHRLELLYDGVDASSGIVPNGLGGVDLSNNVVAGLLLQVQSDVLISGGLQVDIFTDATNSSSIVVDIPNTLGAFSTIFLPFASFNDVNGSGADFSNVGAVRVNLNTTGVPDANIQIDVIESRKVNVFTALAPAVADPVIGVMVTTLNDELDYSNADVSLREAINSANGSIGVDTITFAADLFTGGPGSIELALGELQIRDTVTISGPGQDLLAIDANQQSRVVNVIGGGQTDVTLDGLTITGGRTTGNFEYGGGIYFNSTGTLTLAGSTVSGNSTAGSSARGGGIHTRDGAVTLTDSTVSGNSTTGERASGGGIFTSSGVVTLSGSTVSGNSTAGERASGGAIRTYNNSLALIDSTVSGNSTAGRFAHGGGIYSNKSAVTLSGSTVSGNSTAGMTARGGGIYSHSGVVTLSGSTVSGNSTAGDNAHGGGLFTYSGSVTLRNSTLSGNSSTGRGGGVSIDPRAFSADASLTSHNSIIAGNTDAGGPDSAPDFLSPTLPANLDVRSSLIGDSTGTTLTASAIADTNGNLIGTSTDPIDPLLAPLALNGGPTQTHALLPGSPAIDAGDNALVLAGIETDQRGPGFARILGNRVDIGAFEQRAITSTNLVASVNPVTFGQAVTFTAMVSAAESPGVPTGTVTFTVDGVSQPPFSLDNGRSSFTTSSLGVGSHSIVAVYSGNSTLLPSTSATVSINVVVASDFGDAPAPYPVALANNGARHTTGDLFLGASVDAEADGTPSVNADSDNGDDGVFVLSTFITTNVATTSSFSVTASQAGKLDGWIDFNRDGDWSDAGEQIFNSVDVVAGENLLSFTIPAGATSGSTGARFRLSSAGGLVPTGAAADGEVEDYIAEIVAGSATATLRIDVPGGTTNVVVQGSDLVARQGTTVLSRVPLARFGELNLNGSSLDDVLQLTIIEALATKKLVIDGGLGKDFLDLVESGQTIDLTNASITVREIEGIDITGTGNNTLVISIDSVKAASSTTDTLQVVSNAGGAISFGDGWQAEQPRFIDGQFTHVITETAASGTARVEVQNDRFFQNPLNRFDVDRNGSIEPLDALQVLNAMRRSGIGTVTLPTNDGEVSIHYPDVNGDNELVPLDALLILTAIARINRGGLPEGEVLSPPLDFSSTHLKQEMQRTLVDIALTEFEPIAPLATFGLADVSRVAELDIDDWMETLESEDATEESEEALMSFEAVRIDNHMS